MSHRSAQSKAAMETMGGDENMSDRRGNRFVGARFECGGDAGGLRLAAFSVEGRCDSVD